MNYAPAPATITLTHGDNRPVSPPSQSRLCFDRFEVLPASRSVLRDGKPIDLGGRAFDLLMVLLRSRGEVVHKEEIVDYVWPRTIVGEHNLRVQIALLRRSLGTARDLIKTVSGRGYLLATDVNDGHGQDAPGFTAFSGQITHWGARFSYAR